MILPMTHRSHTSRPLTRDAGSRPATPAAGPSAVQDDTMLPPSVPEHILDWVALIERLGGVEATPIDVRVIAGTKRDLRALVKEGRFREDLYYRLNVLPVELPPLRERKEDIPVLARHFLERYFERQDRVAPPLSDGARRAFLAYDWPGNVRELENACERAAQSSSCGRVGVGCVAASVLFHGGTEASRFAPVSESDDVASPSADVPAARRFLPDAPAIALDEHLRRVESDLIQWALEKSGGNKSRAAALLGIKRSTLGDRITRGGLSGPGSG